MLLFLRNIEKGFNLKKRKKKKNESIKGFSKYTEKEVGGDGRLGERDRERKLFFSINVNNSTLA